ncbi:hypothetical protein [Streptomyces erythrochromogenes]|uniref:hypothetical protein n=1 Tax=Streptomyces erythrochromogenes TaxID=285574 RepID=UPI0036B323D7
MDTLTALASAAFGSTVCLATFSTVNRLRQLSRRSRIAGLVVTGTLLCAVIGTVAVASRSVAVGFIAGAVLTPPVHRWIVQRRRHVVGP